MYEKKYCNIHGRFDDVFIGGLWSRFHRIGKGNVRFCDSKYIKANVEKWLMNSGM